MAGISTLDKLVEPAGLTFTMASFGSVSAVLFAAPDSPAARKYNIFVSHIGCAAIGVASLALFGPGWIARSVSLAASIAFMQYTGALHPPAAALPLILISAPKFQRLQWWYVLFPSAIGCILLCLLVSSLKSCLISEPKAAISSVATRNWITKVNLPVSQGPYTARRNPNCLCNVDAFRSRKLYDSSGDRVDFDGSRAVAADETTFNLRFVRYHSCALSIIGSNNFWFSLIITNWIVAWSRRSCVVVFAMSAMTGSGRSAVEFHVGERRRGPASNQSLVKAV